VSNLNRYNNDGFNKLQFSKEAAPDADPAVSFRLYLLLLLVILKANLNSSIALRGRASPTYVGTYQMLH